jgi:hypothetical protein
VRADRRAPRALLGGALLLMGSAGSTLGAQQPDRASRWQPELRADAFGGEPWAAHAGAGLGVRLGLYARLVVLAGAGMSGGLDEGDGTRASGRVEVLGRFVLDPFRERSRGPYAAAGLVQRLEGARPRTRLTAVFGVEGQPRGSWVPAFEAGFGGGVRAGVVLRRARADGR